MDALADRPYSAGVEARAPRTLPGCPPTRRGCPRPRGPPGSSSSRTSSPAPTRSAREREGYGVEVADTGAAGLDAVRRDEPDVVLLDLMLPDMDGRDVCRS